MVKAITETLGIQKKAAPTPTPAPTGKKLYKVQVGAFSVKGNADALVKKLKAAGFRDAYIKYE